MTDVAGNTSSTICSGTYKVDTTNPTAKISASSSGSNITVSASGSSDAHSGIASYQYSRNNSTWYTSTSNSYTFTGLSDGTYTVYVKITDKSGRVSGTVSTTVTVSTSLTLLNNGNNGSSGWGCKSYGEENYATSCTKTSNGIQIYASSSSDSSGPYTVIYTTQKIDISKYSTLNFTVTADAGGVTVYLLDSLPSTVSDVPHLSRFGTRLSTVFVSYNVMTNETIDISSKSGSYYIAFQTMGGGNSGITLQLHNVSLKP